MRVVTARLACLMGILLVVAASSWLVVPQSMAAVATPEASAAVRNAAVSPPTAPHQPGVRFEPNQGQAPDTVRYLGRGKHVVVSLLDRGAVIETVRPAAPARITMSFSGASVLTGLSAHDASQSHSTYLLGNDASKWVRDVPNYGQVRYRNLYRNVDLVYYGNRGELEYDLVVMPGGDPRRIRMRFDGDHAPQISGDGDLLLDGAQGGLRMHRPVVYQNMPGGRKLLTGRFVRRGEREIGIHVGHYDDSRPLIIDPSFKLLYSTYEGGVHDDQTAALVLDSQNNSYIVGFSGSEDFPVSASAVQSERKNIGVYVRNVVVSKFSPAGDLLYSTFLGGSVNDYGRNIAVDAAGNAYVVGVTYSADFPTTAGAFQSARAGDHNAFLAVLGPDGSTLKLSTLYGGAGGSEDDGIRLRGDKVYLAGSAGTGLATTTGAYKTTLAMGSGGFVAIFDPTRTGAAQLVAATYYGTDTPAANNVLRGLNAIDLALGPDGSAWIGGQAFTNNIPTTSDALKPTVPALSASCAAGDVPLNGAAYVAHLSADLRTLVYATYLSGEREYAANAACSEYVYGLQTDSAGNLYVHGTTASGSFPVTTGAVQATFPGTGGFNGFVGFASKLSADGHMLLWSTYVGGNASGGTFANHTYLDTNGAFWITGVTPGGSNFPLTNDAFQKTSGGGPDAYVVSLDAQTGALRYGSYFGGSGTDVGAGLGIDAGGTIYLAGYTTSVNLPVTTTAFQSALTPNAFDGNDWFFAMMGSGAIAQVMPVRAGNVGDVTLTVKGAGFQTAATASLTLGSGAPIQSAQSWIADDGSSATFTFALKDAPAGAYQLTVNNPDQTSFSRKDALTVDSGGASNVSAEVIGRSTVRVGAISAYDVVVTNSGTADAYGVVLMVPRLPAGASATFTFPLKAAMETDDAYIEAYVWDPIAESAEELKTAFAPSTQSAGAHLFQALSAALGRVQPASGAGASQACFNALLQKAIDKALSAIPGVDCLKDFSAALASAITAGEFANSIVAGDAFGQLGTNTIKAMSSCVPVAKVVKVLADLISFMEDAQNIADACKDKAKPKPSPKGSKKKPKPKKSTDPNDKVGPEGDGSVHHYLTGTQPFTYSIEFENQATASLPAAEVVVTDQLDPATLDLDTFTLGNITIGHHVVNVPAGTSNYNTTYALDANLSVRIQGSLDKQSGVLKYTFVTIDPATGLPPSDPTLGFLPPDTDGVTGQAYVLFTVRAKSGLVTGTEIKNQASIVFDTNAAIQTPVWTNTIDTAAPASHVTALPSSQTEGAFNVSWSGTDSDAGILSYSVYMSDNAGAFTKWQSDVATATASFTGVAGHSYGFYSVATDGAGNVETSKTVADTSTSVTSTSTGGGGTGGGGTGGGGTSGGGSSSGSHGGGGSFDWLTLAVGFMVLAHSLRQRSRVGRPARVSVTWRPRCD